MAEQIAIGSVVRGKYRVERVLGEGGMGTVLSAWHEHLDQRVALKVLLPELVAHGPLLERFKREAQAASRIRSDHVARVIDVDALESGAPFMVMEYLEGQDLASLPERWLPARTAVEYVLQACDAIAEAHALGIVHRDIKPANLFLTRSREGRPLVKVLDFGISKVEKTENGRAASVTKTSAVMGSVVYMSPEQMLSARDVDARTDIWSLGVTLYELCTGELPFYAETLPQVCALVMNTVPAPPRSHRPDLPEELSAVILRCLDKDRDRRYASIAALVDALAPHAGERDPTEVARLAHAIRPALAARPAPAPAETLVRLIDDVSTTAPGLKERPSEAPTKLDLAPSVPEAARTQLAVENVVAERRGRPAARLVALGVALACALLGLGAWLSRGRVSDPAALPTPSISAAASAAPALDPALPLVTPEPASSVSAAPAARLDPPEPSAGPKLPAKKPAGAKPPAAKPVAGPSAPSDPSIY
jgi:serine/threonine-protein kinase